jgi:hypothetical protein
MISSTLFWFPFVFPLGGKVKKDGNHHGHDSDADPDFNAKYAHGASLNRVEKKNLVKPTVIEIFPSQDKTEDPSSGIDDHTHAAKKKIPLFAHPFLHFVDVIGQAQQNETCRQDHPSLKASSWTVMAMGDDVETIQLDERREDSTDGLDDDVFKKGDHLIESPDE